MSKDLVKIMTAQALSLRSVVTMITIFLVQSQFTGHIEKSISWINKSSNLVKHTTTIKENIFKLF